ncbi:unnamed protein product, partial [marine sediment metagenome]
IKRPYELHFNQKFVNIDDLLADGDFTNLHSVMILVREEILKYPFMTEKGNLKLEYDLPTRLDDQNFSRIYDCGSTSGYLQP